MRCITVVARGIRALCREGPVDSFGGVEVAGGADDGLYSVRTFMAHAGRRM